MKLRYTLTLKDIPTTNSEPAPLPPSHTFSQKQQTVSILTAEQLHPGTRLVDGGRVAEEKEGEAADAAEDEHHGHQHKERGRLEGAGRDGAEIEEGSLAHKFPVGVPVAHAVVEQAEVPGLGAADAVADPVGLYEDDDVDDWQADGEDGPQDPDGPGVAHVVVMVDFGSFLQRQHFSHPPLPFPHSLSEQRQPGASCAPLGPPLSLGGQGEIN